MEFFSQSVVMIFYYFFQGLQKSFLSHAPNHTGWPVSPSGGFHRMNFNLLWRDELARDSSPTYPFAVHTDLTVKTAHLSAVCT